MEQEQEQNQARDSLRAALATKLPDKGIDAFKDVHLNKLIDLGCVNLTILATMPAEELRHHLPLGLVFALKTYGILGAAAGLGAAGAGAEAAPGLSMVAGGWRLLQDEKNPDLFVLEPLDAASASAVPHDFFLDPGNRVTEELKDYLRLVKKHNRMGKPIWPLLVNGQIKSGKSYLVNVVLPALAREHFTGSGGGSDDQAALREPSFVAVDCLGYERSSGVAGFLKDFLVGLKRSAALQQLSAAASTPVPIDFSGASMVDAIHQFMRNLPRDRINFLLIDEAQSFYLLEQPGSGSLDISGIRLMRRVLKGLLLQSPPWVAWALTGSSMATLWANVAATPANGFALFQDHFRVTLDAAASPETLAVAWEQLQIQYAAANPPLPTELLIQSPPHHAMLAFMCREWTLHGGRTAHTAVELVWQTRTLKLIPEALDDLRRALEVLEEPNMRLGQPDKPLLRLLELLDPLCGVSTASLPLALKVLLTAYATECEDKIIMENPFFRETLQAVISESGELLGNLSFEGIPSLSSVLYRELMLFGECCKQDPINKHLDALLCVMASALGCTGAQLLEEPYFTEVLNHRCNDKPAKGRGAKEVFEAYHRAQALEDPAYALRWYHRFVRNVLAHGTIPEQQQVLAAYPTPLKVIHQDGHISRALIDTFSTLPAPR